MGPDAGIDALRVSAFTVPTDAPEADGTYAWDKTTLVVVELGAGGVRGMGYTYADTATARLIEDKLFEVVKGRDAMHIPGAWAAMVREIRNLGRPGIASMAIAAVDNAFWDLKARLLAVPLVTLLGAACSGVRAYGSGGFTSYTMKQLQKQLDGWCAQGLKAVKMKVGTRPEEDLARVRAAREAVGDAVDLFVDANGAYTRKQALEKGLAFAEYNVSWFEEPVSSDDLEGLRLLRDRGPAGMAIAAGEYGYDLVYFRRMLEAGAVDVLQADATRCAGISEFLEAGALSRAYGVRYSAHTAPSLHTHAMCALPGAWNVEYFHDHARIEQMLFDGAIRPVEGILRPDLTRPGMGLELKRAEAERFKVYESGT